MTVKPVLLILTATPEVLLHSRLLVGVSDLSGMVPLVVSQEKLPHLAPDVVVTPAVEDLVEETRDVRHDPVTVHVELPVELTQRGLAGTLLVVVHDAGLAPEVIDSQLGESQSSELLVSHQLPVSFLPDLVVDGLRHVQTGTHAVTLQWEVNIRASDLLDLIFQFNSVV